MTTIESAKYEGYLWYSDNVTPEIFYGNVVSGDIEQRNQRVNIRSLYRRTFLCAAHHCKHWWIGRTWSVCQHRPSSGHKYKEVCATPHRGGEISKIFTVLGRRARPHVWGHESLATWKTCVYRIWERLKGKYLWQTINSLKIQSSRTR